MPVHQKSVNVSTGDEIDHFISTHVIINKKYVYAYDIEKWKEKSNYLANLVASFSYLIEFV